jgi:hypothetical protein
MTELSELAEKIKIEINAIKETGVEHATKAGKLLKEAKEKVAHGEWMKWLSKNCALSMRTARLYMQLADDPKMATDANLTAGLTLRQAAKRARSDRRPRRKQTGGEVPDYLVTLNETWDKADKDQKRSFLKANIDQVRLILDEREEEEEAPAEQPGLQ